MSSIETVLPIDISNMEDLLLLHDVLLIDIWGVIHNGKAPYPGVLECYEQLLIQSKKILFLSNAPRPGSVLVQALNKFGISATAEMFLSSGDLVREQLTDFSDPVFSQFQLSRRRFYHLGAARNEDILAGLDLAGAKAECVNSVNEADFLLLTAYLDPGEDFNQYDGILEEAASRGLPVICANPDKIVMNGKALRYCAGVLAEKYKELGGTLHYYGKPHAAIYEAALKKLETQGINRTRVLMIGDTLETDIQGAIAAGINSALVLTGNMGLEIEKALGPNPQRSQQEDFLSQYFKERKLRPTYLIPGFSLRLPQKPRPSV